MPSETTNACETRGLTAAYGSELVLRDVSVGVPQGQITAIIGPNGAGKSTLVRAMLGLTPTLHGTTTFFGQQLDRVRTQIGYMPQAASVDWDFPVTVLDVTVMGAAGELGWVRRPGRAHRARAHEALERVGIAGLAQRQIGELSGGQRQRVFLARTLMQDPLLYVMDEPFQGVDAQTEATIMSVLHHLREQQRTVLMVHHDLSTVAEYCDRVILLNQTVRAAGPVATAFTQAALRETYEVRGSADGFLGFLGDGA